MENIFRKMHCTCSESEARDFAYCVVAMAKFYAETLFILTFLISILIEHLIE